MRALCTLIRILSLCSVLWGCTSGPRPGSPPTTIASLPDREPNFRPEPIVIPEPPVRIPPPVAVSPEPPKSIQPELITPLPLPPPPAPNTPAPAPIPSPVENTVGAQDAGTDWVNLQEKLTNLNWTPFRVGGAGRQHTWETTSPAGRWNFPIGKPTIYWGGIELHLGFPTREGTGRQFQVHPIDWDKNIRPLADSRTPPAWTRKSIVIDPGHGGAQPGSRLVTGNQFEKDLTLDWALRLAVLLKNQGWDVILTRTNDMDVSLAERVDLAEQAGAALFISLHFNSSFPNQSAFGLETYCTTPLGLRSTITRDFVDDPSKAYPNNEFDDANLSLAARVHAALLITARMPDRGIRRARFMDVLRWQRRPAILVEGGYMSNPSEAKLLREPGYRQSLAEAIALALDR